MPLPENFCTVVHFGGCVGLAVAVGVAVGALVAEAFELVVPVSLPQAERANIRKQATRIIFFIGVLLSLAGVSGTHRSPIA